MRDIINDFFVIKSLIGMKTLAITLTEMVKITIDNIVSFYMLSEPRQVGA